MYQHKHVGKKVLGTLCSAGAISFVVLLLGSCMMELDAPRSSVLQVSAAAQMQSAGYYGELADVDQVVVSVFRGSETSETGDKLTEMTLTSSNGWTGTAEDVPTMTDLTVTARATGTARHSYNELNWTVSPEHDPNAAPVTMFEGVTTAFISSASAQIYLSMRQYNDGTLQRLPRINTMTSNLNSGMLRVDLNNYAEAETWYWRLLDSQSGQGMVADTSFRWVDDAGTAIGTGTPQGSIAFAAGAASVGDDLFLQYLFPTGDDDVVAWYNRAYTLEIANPQHNVLRQSFVMNPGSTTGFTLNFAPWIRNISAERYQDPTGATSVDEVRWTADTVDNDTTGAIRHVWILKINDYWAVSGDLAATAAIDSDWIATTTELLNGPSVDHNALEELVTPVISDSALLTRTVQEWTDGLPEETVTASSLVVDGESSAAFTAGGALFDQETVAGSLQLLVFDADYGKTYTDAVNSDYIYDSWSYVRMELDHASFPDADRLIVFEGPAVNQ